MTETEHPAAPDEASGAAAAIPAEPGLPSTVHLPRAVQIEQADSDAEITAKLLRHGVRIGRGMISPRVFWPALIVVLSVSLFAILVPDAAARTFNATQDWIVEHLGWYYMITVAVLIAVAMGIAFSRLGRIRLGRDDDEPEFGVLSWFSMLFAAGMGIGLVF